MVMAKKFSLKSKTVLYVRKTNVVVSYRKLEGLQKYFLGIPHEATELEIYMCKMLDLFGW